MQDAFALSGGFTYKSEMRGILNSMAFDESYYNKKIGTLSGGERTRLALACLLMEKPDILLLDEPFNGLDEASWRMAAPLIAARAQEIPVVLVTHVAQHAEVLQAHILRLEKTPLRGELN
jgi:ATP-binding cassette subfamily F protein 3